MLSTSANKFKMGDVVRVKRGGDWHSGYVDSVADFGLEGDVSYWVNYELTPNLRHTNLFSEEELIQWNMDLVNPCSCGASSVGVKEPERHSYYCGIRG